MRSALRQARHKNDSTRQPPLESTRRSTRGAATHLELAQAGVILADALDLAAARLLLALRGLEHRRERVLLRPLVLAAAALELGLRRAVGGVASPRAVAAAGSAPWLHAGAPCASSSPSPPPARAARPRASCAGCRSCRPCSRPSRTGPAATRTTSAPRAAAPRCAASAPRGRAASSCAAGATGQTPWQREGGTPAEGVTPRLSSRRFPRMRTLVEELSVEKNLYKTRARGASLLTQCQRSHPAGGA